MKTNAVRNSFVLLVAFAIILIGCNKSPVGPTDDTNLLLNESFETNHIPTLVGWRFGDPQLAQLVNDAPPGGGNWSLQLTAADMPTLGFIYQPVTDVGSGDIVRLTAFVRVTTEFGGEGFIALSVGTNHYANNSKSSFSSATVWNQISVIDTLELEPDDTLWVILASSSAGIMPCQHVFDIVQLEKITQ